MALGTSALYNELVKIANGDSLPVHNTWTAQFTANGKTFDAMKVVSIREYRDYEADHAPEFHLEVMIDAAVYYNQILPYKQNLIITLRQTPTTELSGNAAPGMSARYQRYRGISKDNVDPKTLSNTQTATGDNATALSTPGKFTFQLMDFAFEQLRQFQTGGIYRLARLDELIRTMLGGQSMSLKLDYDVAVKGVDIVKIDNTQPQDPVVIPQGTRLVDLADYLQAEYGIYNNDLGVFYQSPYWYIYPLFDTTRFDTNSRNLTIANIPKYKFPGTERTYKQVNGQVYVLATGDTKMLDMSEAQQMNFGNGARFAKASQIAEGFASTSKGRATATRALNNNEVLTTQRDTGLNFAPVSGKITDNSYVELSKVAARNGKIVQVTWENSNFDLLYPGMPVHFMYPTANEEIADLYGTVLKIENHVMLKGGMFTSEAYVQYTVITCFLAQRKVAEETIVKPHR